MLTCINCSHKNPDDFTYCDQCGTRLDEALSYEIPTGLECEGCHHLNPSIAKFCELCGANLFEKDDSGGLEVDEKTKAESSKTASGSADSLMGAFISVDDSVQLVFPEGHKQLVVGREDPVSGIYPEIDLGLFGGHEAGVGRVHAKLVLKDGNVFLIDQGSTNGTWLNDIKLMKNDPVKLTDGDQIQFAKLILKFRA